MWHLLCTCGINFRAGGILSIKPSNRLRPRWRALSSRRLRVLLLLLTPLHGPFVFFREQVILQVID